MRQILRRMKLPSWPGAGPMSLLLGVALVVAPVGLVAEHAALAARSAALAPHVATNTIVVTGKYSGTLKLEDPAKNCVELIDISKSTHEPNPRDVVKLYYTGKLSGLSSTKWTFIATEKGGGTFTQSHIATTQGALLYSYTTGFGFVATSGTITIGGKTGSFKYKVTWSNQPGSIGATSRGTDTAAGSWSCPSVTKI